MAINNRDMIRLRKSPDLMAYDCNGCAVCLLSCPVWRQTHDQSLTFCGRMRSMQGGASLEETSDSINKCTLCGSCEPVCSYEVESVMRTIEMRAELRAEGAVSSSDVIATHTSRGRVILANPVLQSNRDMLERTLGHLGAPVLHPDNGDDMSEAMERGWRINDRRLKGFISSLERAAEVVTTDGLIYRLLRRYLPDANIHSLGEVLLKNDGIRNSLGPDDLYVIDARTYNAGFDQLVAFYDNVRKEAGCMMNLDLHRVATPTGTSLHAPCRQIDHVRQAEWILKGRPAARVIVERLEDIEPFMSATKAPVIFVADLG